MKRAFLAFAAALMLTASLTACATRTDTTATSRARTVTPSRGNGSYYADGNGDVADGHDSTLGEDLRDMTNSAANGVRRAGDDVGNALNDITH